MTEVPRLLSTFEAAEYLAAKHGPGFGTPKTLAKLRHTGCGPAFRKIGPRLVGYEPPALDQYAQARISPEIHSTAEAA